MVIDLRPYDKPCIISEGWSLDLSDVANLKIKVSFVLGGGALSFKDATQMDLFVKQFTGKDSNFTPEELKKPSNIIV